MISCHYICHNESSSHLEKLMVETFSRINRHNNKNQFLESGFYHRLDSALLSTLNKMDSSLVLNNRHSHSLGK